VRNEHVRNLKIIVNKIEQFKHPPGQMCEHQREYIPWYLVALRPVSRQLCTTWKDVNDCELTWQLQEQPERIQKGRMNSWMLRVLQTHRKDAKNRYFHNVTSSRSTSSEEDWHSDQE
jgi:hypothetical protein